MANVSIPSTMQAWQYKDARGGLENTMRLTDSVRVPQPKQDQLLVRVVATALNPLDFKPAESFAGSFVTPKGAVPGCDIVGRVVKAGSGSSTRIGELVVSWGPNLMAGGGMAEYALVPANGAVPVSEGVSSTDAAAVPIAGVTAYQSLEPFVKPGSRVFINAGSGGTGTFGIQIAKLLGCHVTTSCSTANVDLCKSLGADVALDYKKSSILKQLKAQQSFDLIVDNVGADHDLYWRAHEYSNPGARYVFVAFAPAFSVIMFTLKARFVPGFLGGGKRKFHQMFAKMKYEDINRVVAWMAEGKVKAVIDSSFPFEQGAEAMRKLKSGRAKGKIIVEVAADPGKA